ncbi:6-hydroxycyclohex-1-ene-1-carbonyl-CoA dehydrogenase [Motiliproteus sp. SC1-56]|uniref:6-hydroxycyclohex-1-ene-1-carbonyl-CoA dehydrogenase n=1 Tax=Motiliproteus sp. SC1-56 TaxID=2799565 RepID=UPI001A8F1B1E|nr:6-hydroxycyclohex-1-ene-1-carbonyl-CoA dehydrogenase [Motiliproteus sp. SC1-56]
MTTAYRWVMTEVGQPLKKVQFQLEAPGPGEVCVEVAGCGVCHTDLGFLYDGVRTNSELPLALGHEISGRVIAAGKGCEASVGKAVIIPAVLPCYECDLCQRGLHNICRGQKMPGNDIQGGFASHITVPGHCLCDVDEERLAQAGLELADVSVIADAVTTPYQAAAQAAIQEGDLAIVIGVGGVGGYAVQIASAMGATVVAIDVDDAKLESYLQYGAALTLNAKHHDARALKKAVQGFAREQGLRSTEWKIFECSGTAAGQATAFSLLTFGATLAVVGFTMAKQELRLSNLMAFHAKAQGNWGCSPEYYPDALEMVLQGKIAMKPFTQQHPLEEINQIFAAAHDHKLSARAILVP